MTRRITLSIALVLSVVLVSLTISASTVQAARQFTADTGVITPGPNQRVRLSVFDDPFFFDAGAVVQFTGIRYTQGICNSEGVCRHTVASQTTAIWINQAEIPSSILSFDIPGTGSWGVRGIVKSNRRIVVNAQIIDVETGNVDAIIAILIG